jgi:hypothetical protein
MGNDIPVNLDFGFVGSDKVPEEAPINLHFPGSVDLVSNSTKSEQMYLSFPTSQGN